MALGAWSLTIRRHACDPANHGEECSAAFLKSANECGLLEVRRCKITLLNARIPQINSTENRDSTLLMITREGFVLPSASGGRDWDRLSSNRFKESTLHCSAPALLPTFRRAKMDDRSVRVAIIDDDENAFVTTRSLLDRARRGKYLVHWTNSFESGLAAILRAEHDVYLVNCRLGARDGFDLIREAVSRGHSGPFIVLTNEGTEGIDLEAIRVGAADYLNKAAIDTRVLERSLTYAVELARRTAAERKLAEAHRELDVARAIQQRLLPREVPQLTGLDLAGRCQPTAATGGDFFDYIPLANGTLMVAVADVSSHGFGPAIVMSQTRRLVRTLAQMGHCLADILTITNRALAEDMDGLFVTLFLAEIDPQKRTLRYSGAGHDGYRLSKSGVLTHLESTGMPLGAYVDAEFDVSETISLQAGDLVTLFTDGFQEARSPGDKQFGTARVLDHLKAHQSGMAAEIIRTLFQSVVDFCHPDSPHDDTTAVVLKIC
jgi:phosphoserine phosphatase RsbU/P